MRWGTRRTWGYFSRWVYPFSRICRHDWFSEPMGTRSGFSAAGKMACGRIQLCVAVNLSTRDLDSETLPQEIAARLAHYKLPPESLMIEITESTLMADLTKAVETLDKIRALGLGSQLMILVPVILHWLYWSIYPSMKSKSIKPFKGSWAG